jgi:predicted Zn-dependent protease
VAPFDHVYVLREEGSGGDMASSLGHMADLLAADPRHSRLGAILRGSVYQAGNEISQAAEAYRSAGTYFPIASEYLQTATGFATRGEMAKAWQEATTSKYWEPNNPDVHDWLARQLAEEAYPDESRAETEVAAALRGSP